MEQAARPRGRFAPSPSGRMHLGNLFSALLAWLSVRSSGGTLVLRIEDLDPDRCRPAYAAQLADDLRWLGLDWDEGYQIGSQGADYCQSRRTAHYAAAFDALDRRGLLYPCYCTRAERLAASAPHGTDEAVYNGHCRALHAAGQSAPAQTRRPAWRLRVPAAELSFCDGCCGDIGQNLARDCGDFIVRRADGVYAYQLAVVVDDGAMGITQVVRGRDLLDSTPRQCYLYDLLGLPRPTFYHVPLLCAPDGRRLSKRDGDLDMGALRARFSPAEVLGFLAFLAGQAPSPAPVTAQALAAHFSWASVPGENIVLSAQCLKEAVFGNRLL